MNDCEPDIRRLWHDQPREPVVSIDEIRSKADWFRRKVRRWNAVTALIFVLAIVVEAWQVWREPALLERVGDGLTMAAIVYVMYRYRESAMAPMPAGLGLTASVHFYRHELARQRDLAAHPWRFYAPFLPGVALSLLGRALERPAVQSAAVAAIGITLFLTAVWLNRRTAHQLQLEIDELR
jgi:hypothetical protein